MERYFIQIDVTLISSERITITAPLFCSQLPSEEEINDIIRKSLNERVLNNIMYRNVVIRL